jgi:hypothetical protein
MGVMIHGIQVRLRAVSNMTNYNSRLMVAEGHFPLRHEFACCEWSTVRKCYFQTSRYTASKGVPRCGV